MATKKEASSKKQLNRSVAKAPDLEKKRKEFQAVASQTKSSPRKKAAPKHHTPRKRTIVILIAAFLAIFGTGSIAYGYYFWNQTPERVVADALLNAGLSESATFTVDVNSPTRSLASMSGHYVDDRGQAEASIKTMLPGELSTVSVSTVMTPSELYMKVPRASQLISEVAPPAQRSLANVFTPVLKSRVDNKWVYMQPADAALLQGVTHMSSCTVDSLRMLMTSRHARSSLVNTYIQHSFLETKEAKVEKNYGTYQLTINHDAFNEFLDALPKADSSVPFQRCVSEVKSLRQSKASTSVIELTIDISSRKITQAVISAAGAENTTIMITPVFGQAASVEKPDDAVRLDEVKSLLYSLFSN